MLRIAIVEDNEDNRMLLQALLEGLYAIDEYVDGPSALAGIPDSVPAVVLLDISLPGMDGTAVLAALRADERTSRVPVVALTAHAMSGDAERFAALGFDAYVTKPIVDEAILIEAIDRLVASRGER